MAVRDDVETLQRVLRVMDLTLEWLTRSGIRDPQFRSRGLVVWTSVSRHLSSVTGAIGDIKDDRAELWIRLESVGLTGETLSLKVYIFQQIVTSLQVADVDETVGQRSNRTTPKGAMKRLLKWFNSFLGSLGKALKGFVLPIDFVKEYKESVELVVEHQRSLAPPPPKIFDGI